MIIHNLRSNNFYGVPDSNSDALPCNNLIFHKRYGFDIPENDVKNFLDIIEILKEFLESKEDLVLIYETIANPIFVSIFFNSNDFCEDILVLKDNKTNWKMPQMGYKWGYKWCDLNCIITRQGALKILDFTSEIDECFSDKLLTLSSTGYLNVEVFIDPDIMIVHEETNYDKNRNNTVLSTIFRINAWSPKDKKMAINILETLFSYAKLLDIKVFINEGTLLGFVRHGKIMDWDDDIDVAVDAEEIEELISKIESSTDLSTGKYYWRNEHLFYKIWSKNGSKIDGFPYTFPFIDLWVYNVKEKETIQFNFGDSYPINIVFPLNSADFEGIEVSVPNVPKQYLMLKYPSWDTELVVFTYSHRNESAQGRRPLKAYISVDDNGRLISNKYS